MKLNIADAKAPPDPKFKEKFDVINIRYLQVGMHPEDWETVTRNMYDMLKPGGWLQWLEPDLWQATQLTRQDPKKLTVAQEIYELLRPYVHRFEYPCKELADIFRKVGIRNVIDEKISSDRIPETRPLWTEVNADPIYRVLLTTQCSKGSDGYSAEECARL